MRNLIIDNYIIETPVIDIINRIRLVNTTGKLKDIQINGDNIVVTCPFHKDGFENTASGNIYIGSDIDIPYGFFRCFGCGKQCSFEKFVAECLNTSEDYAKKWLIMTFDSQIAAQKIQLDEPINLLNKLKKQNTTKIDESVLNEYQNWCPYLATRGLNREVCEQFKIKYDPKMRQIIFPCYDEHNNLTALLRRSIDTKTFYIPSEIEKPIYGLNNIIKNNISKAIITEGPFDMLKGNMFGVPTVAMLGNISENQIEQLNKSCLKVVYTMFDNDESGKKFTNLLRKKLNKRILFIEVPIPAGHKDLGELTYEEFWENFNKYAKN